MSRLVLLCLSAAALAGVAAAGTGPAVTAECTELRSVASSARVEARRMHVPRPPVGERAARIAVAAIGSPYRWGGAGLGGFDCSGLVAWAYGRAGIPLPHNAWAQSRLGRPVARGALRPGDLLFFHGYGHVGIYIGRGRMVHAPQSGERVRITRVAGRDGRRFETARRLRAA